MTAMSRVWIEEGCIPCYACTTIAPDVFLIPEDTAVVLGEARCDGVTSRNVTEQSRLNAVGLEYEDAIRDAADSCPVMVIHFDSA